MEAYTGPFERIKPLGWVWGLEHGNCNECWLDTSALKGILKEMGLDGST